MISVADNYICSWMRLSLIVIILMITIGGITRLTQSGLSIPYWKPIIGIFPPISSNQWIDEFNEYLDTLKNLSF